MTIAVTDANVFIDLYHIRLLHLLFELKHEIIVTAEVIEELNETQKDSLAAFIESGQLLVYYFTTDELSSLMEFHLSPALSFSDHSVLFLAQKIAATVLSGDNRLRKECIRQKIPVHGILWIFDTAMTLGLITYTEAIQALESLMTFNKRLPVNECRNRLIEWDDLIKPVIT
jgi:predicted nucleic acid-binding protein